MSPAAGYTPRGGQGWEMFHRSIWTDHAFLELSVDARLLFIWCFTAPSNALVGLYHVSPRMLERALAETAGPSDPALRGRIRSALVELARKPLVVYDDDAEVLWVVRRAAYANRSPNVRKRLRREFDECPPSPLKAEFWSVYGEALDLASENGASS